MLIATLLILSLPVWDALLEPLVIIASEVVTWFLAWFDITVLIEGNSILTPYGRILIAEGCSGIRYLLVAIVLGALVSHVNHYRFRGSAAALAIFTFVGLLSNWVRIILLIFTGYFTNMESSLMHDHEVFGWIIYSVFFLPIIYFAPRSNAAIKTERHTAPLNLAPMLIALITLIIVINVSLFIAQSQFRTETKHPVSPVADSFIQESLPAELKTLPMTTLNDLTWYASKFTSTRVGIFNNSKNSMEEKLIPYIPQSLVNERWFNEKKYSLHLNGLNVETHQLKSLYSNQRLLRAQVYATGTLWSSEYSIAKLQQVPALLSGNNLFTYYLFVTPCVTFNCENAISELSRDIQDILAK
jgi:exosortase/archaeosortase family protein